MKRLFPNSMAFAQPANWSVGDVTRSFSRGMASRSSSCSAARARAAPYTGWAGFNAGHGLPREQAKELLEACLKIKPDYAKASEKLTLVEGYLDPKTA